MNDIQKSFDFMLGWRRIAELSNLMLSYYFWITRIKPRCPKDEELLRAYPAIDNATVESSLLSIRILDDFFGNSKKNPDDVTASDFDGFAASTGFLTKDQRKDINKSVAHLTMTRLDPTPTKYPYAALLKGAIPRCTDFLNFVISSGKVTNKEDVLFLKDTRAILDAIKKTYVAQYTEPLSDQA
jgi:hypothetical protein